MFDPENPLSPDPGTIRNVATATLFALSLTFKKLSTHFHMMLPPDLTALMMPFWGMFDSLFKTLSLLSVVMVITINFPKFYDRLLKIKSSWKTKKRRK